MHLGTAALKHHEQKHYERDNIQRMTGYSWGEQPDAADVIKLNTNENPYPPSPAVAAALAGVDTRRLRRYPPPLANDFRDQAASLHGVQRNWIIATNGGDELLRLLVTTFMEPGTPLATTAPSYSLYPVLAAVQGCATVEVPLGDGFTLPRDLAAQANTAGAGLTCVVNPHAPTGRLFSVADVDALAAALDGLLLIDEAYVDFVDPDRGHDAVSLVRRHPNVVLLRTLSKGYALAGLRFGYGIAQPHIIAPMLEKTRDSYNLDLIAQVLATAAISDQSWARDNSARVRAQRRQLADGLQALGFDVPPSQANFLFARVPSGRDALALKHALQAAGILVRHFPSPGLDDRLRISIGSEQEHGILLQRLSELLE
ncbi:MAG: histidinol-phosphate transaminase [Gammaproteobacteria bacterium]|nr:histidinol-phosphate transaminase [Gammaproteobacteria bacterium]